MYPGENIPICNDTGMIYEDFPVYDGSCDDGKM